MKTTTISPTNARTITINTLREQAGEMLRVADHLEATQKFTVASGTNTITIGTRRRPLTMAARKKIAAAQKARWATKKKGPAIVAKAA